MTTVPDFRTPNLFPAEGRGGSAANMMELLRQYWGFDSLRPLQEEVINASLAGKDALVVMPTGGGKSLCFQLPALLSEGLTLVVSPLISLMKDQVDGLRLIGYPGALLNSSLSDREESEVFNAIRDGSIKLLYTSPERLVSARVQTLLSQAHDGKGVSRIAIDEAHCISQWGHDFRPEYRQMSLLRRRFPGVPIHAFTATATPTVRKDIEDQLDLVSAEHFIGIFDRPNLTYRILPKEDSVAVVADAVRRYPDEAVIVYCISRKDTEKTADKLKDLGLKAEAYHAGLGTAERRRISEDFARERLNVVVATVAFGMGIDRANVRCVIHDSMPKSIEGYQQETGRAGRDGLPSECIMLYNNGDFMRWLRVIKMEVSDYTQHQIKLLEEVRGFATGTVCRHFYLSHYFGQSLPRKCNACDICLDGFQAVEGSTKIAHKILVTLNDLRKLSPSFGIGHFVEVLCGANVKRLRDRQHDTVRGFGCLKDVGRARVQAWIHQLVDLGLLAISDSEFPVVLATEAGQEVLRQRGEVALRNTQVTESKSSKRRILRTGGPLFELLREERRRIAEELKVPAYVIFHDSTLEAIASARPKTVEEFRKLPGVGESKVRTFGERFMKIVRDHAEV